MNPRDLPPGRWTATRLPDGRYILAPWDDPVAPAIRRFNAARVTDRTALGDPGDLAAITAWADEREPLRPRLLDLCCCQGGAATGYDRAGFDVTGVDIEPQPRYPFRFAQADVLDVLDHWDLSPFAVIHVSPPCQFATQMSARWRKRGGTIADDRPDLLTPVLERVRRLSVPWVVENVVGAKRYMNPTLSLHGGMFGLGVHRPRLFESNVLLLAPKTAQARNPVGVYGTAPDGRRLWTRQNGNMTGKRSVIRAARSVDEARELMGMPWADWHGCKEAIPPAYAEFIGAQLLDHLAADGLTRTGTGAVA